jgi:hypothetical protein
VGVCYSDIAFGACNSRRKIGNASKEEGDLGVLQGDGGQHHEEAP